MVKKRRIDLHIARNSTSEGDRIKEKGKGELTSNLVEHWVVQQDGLQQTHASTLS